MKTAMRKLIALACASALLLPFAFGCSGQEEKGAEDPEAQRAEFVSAIETRVVDEADGVTTKSINETEGSTLVSVIYPAFSESEQVSGEMERFANEAVSSFRSQADAVHAQDESAICSLTMTYKPYVADGIFSVKFTRNTQGTGTDLKNYVDAYSYSRATGARLGLDDVFDAAQDYLTAVSDTAKEYLLRNEVLRKYMNEDQFAQGTAPDQENFSNFLVTPTAIQFVFNPNTVAPAEAGTLEVSLPIAEFDAVLNPDNKKMVYGANGAGAVTLPDTLPEQQGSSEYADYQTQLKQLKIEGNFMQPGSLDGIDPWNDKVIALTFDDGPNETLTPKLLDILKENDVVATFFVVGKNVAAYPEIVKREYDEGHEIGTHSWNHPEHSVWKNLSAGDKLEQYKKANDAIEAATGLRALIDRPPGGAMTEEEAAQIGREQIIWSMDPNDWYPDNRDPDIIYDHVINGGEGGPKTEAEGYVKDGGVILSHDIHPTTVDAYDRIIKELKSEGYKFVTITQMMQIAEIRGGDVKYNFYHAPTAEEAAAGKEKEESEAEPSGDA